MLAWLFFLTQISLSGSVESVSPSLFPSLPVGSFLSPQIPYSDHTTCPLSYCHSLQDHLPKSKPLSSRLPRTPIHPGHASSLNFLKESLWLWESLLWDAPCSFVVQLQPPFSPSQTHSGNKRVMCLSPYLHGHFLPLCFCTCSAPSQVSIPQHSSSLRPFLILPARGPFLLYL